MWTTNEKKTNQLYHPMSIWAIVDFPFGVQNLRHLGLYWILAADFWWFNKHRAHTVSTSKTVKSNHFRLVCTIVNSFQCFIFVRVINFTFTSLVCHLSFIINNGRSNTAVKYRTTRFSGVCRTDNFFVVIDCTGFELTVI